MNIKNVRLVSIILLLLFAVGCGTGSTETSKNAPLDGNVVAEQAVQTEEAGKEEADVEETRSATEHGTGGQTLELHYIDVGQGSSQLLYHPGEGKTLLFDTGENDDEESIVEYIQNLGIDTIDLLILSHPHADHIGGADQVIREFEIGDIYMPEITTNTETFEDVLLAIQEKGEAIHIAKAGVELPFTDDVQINLVAPIDRYDDLNAMSAVVHITFGETSFLLTGDIEEASERDIVRSGAKISSNVLASPHHGSDTSSSPEFLDAVNPSYVVIQSGADNSYGHPHEEVLDRYEERGIEVYRNDLHGHVIAISDGRQITFETRKDEPEVRAIAAAPAPAPAAKKEITQPDENDQLTEIIVETSINNKQPKQNSEVTVTVKATDSSGQPISDASVTLTAAYKSKESMYEATTNDQGMAAIPFRIGRAAKDYTVNVTLVVEKDGVSGRGSTAFTPQ